MSTDELEELIKKLLAKGVTVIVLTLGPAGQLAGATPDAGPPPSDAGSAQVEAPATADRPPLVRGEDGGGRDTDRSGGIDRDGTGTGSGSSGADRGGTGGAPNPDDPDATAVDGDVGVGVDGGPAGSGERGRGGPGDRGDTGNPGAAGGTTGAAPSGNGTIGDAEVSGAGATAAERFGWGEPVRTDDFTEGTAGWNIYDGPGHAGNGRRTPEAVSVADGVLTITGDAEGNTAGLAWTEGSQKYGRWEGRVRAPASDPSYNALLLLWPTAENFPEGGEVDFMEMMDPTRQKTNMFLHYGADNSQIDGAVEVDGTRWHNWAVEWTPDRIAAFVDGEQWFETTDTSILPPGPMHLCIQLDWFPKGGSVQESQMHVDWVRQYALG